jgi:hypothetical protein
VPPEAVPPDCIRSELAGLDGNHIDTSQVVVEHREVAITPANQRPQTLGYDVVWFTMSNGDSIGRQIVEVAGTVRIVPEPEVCEAKATELFGEPPE